MRFSAHSLAFRVISFGAAVFLVSCAGMPGMDARKSANGKGETPLSSKPEPEVKGVEQTMRENAEAAVKSGDFQKAAVFYLQLADQHQDKPEYRFQVAESLRRGGKLDDAINQYDLVLNANPSHVDAMEGKALALIAKAKFDEAGTLLESVMQKDQKRWRTLNAAGILFAMKNLSDEAMSYFEEALRVSPDNSTVLNNVGLALAMDRQFDKSLKALEKASSLVPAGSQEKKRHELNRALVLGVAGKLPEAEKVASQYLQGPQLYNNLGYYAHLSKDDQMAKTYLSMALTKSPVYYAKAWENLESVESKTPGKNKNTLGGKSVSVKQETPAAAETKPVPTTKPEAKKAEPKKETKEKKEESKKPASAEVKPLAKAEDAAKAKETSSSQATTATPASSKKDEKPAAQTAVAPANAKPASGSPTILDDMLSNMKKEDQAKNAPAKQ